MIMVSTIPPKYAEIVPIASPPRVPIITGRAAAVSADLAPQINLPRRSYPYFVVPNGWFADESEYGISTRRFERVKLSKVNGVNQGAYTVKKIMNKIIPIPTIVNGFKKKIFSEEHKKLLSRN